MIEVDHVRHSIPIIAVFSMACSVYGADHLLDQADQALNGDRIPQAIALYRQANAELPTTEGYNNLGVALERSGYITEATEAYAEAQVLPQAGRESRSNLRRARLRMALQAGLPYALSIFLGLFGAFMAIRLVAYLQRAWTAWRYRLRFKQVRMLRLSHRIQCRGGEYQPDGRLYDDSESLSVNVELNLPDRSDIYPMDLELRIIRPDGRGLQTLREEIPKYESDRASIWFEIGELAEIRPCSGEWRLELWLRNINKQLGATTVTVVTREDLIADLTAAQPKLITMVGDKAIEDSIVFSDVEGIVPKAIIRPRTLHPLKYRGIALRLDLVRLDKDEAVESLDMALELPDGAMDFCPASRPVAGDEIARKIGQWEFRLSAEGRSLTKWPFTITSFECAVDAIRLEGLDVIGVPRRGRPGRVATTSYIANLRSLCPNLRFTTRFPSRRTSYQMSVGVCVNGEPVGGIEGPLILDRSSVELLPGEFEVPPLPDDHDQMRISFIVLVEGRTLGVQEITLRLRPPRCADAQGRITDTRSRRDMDYDSEASRILGDARVAA
jgi:tetratricopeptide (TPR) repeat protein